MMRTRLVNLYPRLHHSSAVKRTVDGFQGVSIVPRRCINNSNNGLSSCRELVVRHSRATYATRAHIAHIRSLMPAHYRKRNTSLIVGGAVGAMALLQYFFGSTKDGVPFYEYRFVAQKDSDDLAAFYGGEDLMELFCVIPVVGNIMMKFATFDNEGNVHTIGMPGTLKVQMVFSDQVDDATGKIVWFNKRERFKDTLFGITMWDYVINYGFTSLPDGRVSVYHQGEYFRGYSPPFSLLMKAFFRIHARYMVWATEHHINHLAFTSETEQEKKIETESRKFMLWHMLKHHFLSDFKAMVFGSQTGNNSDSFLTKNDNVDSAENDNGKKELKGLEKKLFLRRKQTIGPIMRAKITDDIAFDRTISQMDIKIDESALDEMPSSSKAYAKAYQMATLAASKRQLARRSSEQKQ